MELYNFIQLSTDKLSENGILDFYPKKDFLAFCERISAAIFNFPLQLKVKPRYLYSLTVSNISWEYKNDSFSSFLIFLFEKISFCFPGVYLKIPHITINY